MINLSLPFASAEGFRQFRPGSACSRDWAQFSPAFIELILAV